MAITYSLKVHKKERRISNRMKIPLKFIYKCGGKNKEILTQDISGGGMKIRVDRRFKKGERLSAQLYFPQDNTPVAVVSEVMWCKKRKIHKEEVFDVGIRNVRVRKPDRQRFVFLFCEMMMDFFLFGNASK